MVLALSCSQKLTTGSGQSWPCLSAWALLSAQTTRAHHTSSLLFGKWDLSGEGKRRKVRDS